MYQMHSGLFSLQSSINQSTKTEVIGSGLKVKIYGMQILFVLLIRSANLSDATRVSTEHQHN